MFVSNSTFLGLFKESCFIIDLNTAMLRLNRTLRFHQIFTNDRFAISRSLLRLAALLGWLIMMGMDVKSDINILPNNSTSEDTK